MPTCFSEQLMEQSRSAPDGWGWGAAWETRTIIFILHLLLLSLSLLSYYIIVIVIILSMGSSPGNKNHRLFQSTLILKQLANQWLIESEDPMNKEKNHVFHSISFLSTPIKQNTTSKEKDWLWFSWCTSSPSPLSMELPWVPLSNEVFWLYTQNTQTWSGHSCDHSGSRTQWGKEDRWKRNTCSWFLLWGRKPGPGGSSFWTQQLTPGEKCNSTWNLGFNIIMRDFFWTNNMQ